MSKTSQLDAIDLADRVERALTRAFGPLGVVTVDFKNEGWAKLHKRHDQRRLDTFRKRYIAERDAERARIEAEKAAKKAAKPKRRAISKKQRAAGFF